MRFLQADDTLWHRRGMAPHRPSGFIGHLLVRMFVLVLGGGAWGPIVLAEAQDVVTVRVPGSRQVTRLQGEVLDYNGKELVLRRDSGHQERIAAQRVVQVHSRWCLSHTQAENLHRQGQWVSAIPLWRQALSEEQRPWVRRMILARLVRCHFEVGQFDVAGELFQSLVQEDPHTPYMGSIPIPWGEVAVPASLEVKAEGWIASDLPPVQLLGAAWLLVGPQSQAAQAVLGRLAHNQDERVAWLATAQRWRIDYRSITPPAPVLQWQSLIERMAPELRAGPYYVLAQAYQQQGDADAAVLAFLRVALVYTDQRRLASQALWSAATLLEKTDRDATVTLLRELIERFPESPLVPEAQRRLDGLGLQSKIDK